MLFLYPLFIGGDDMKEYKSYKCRSCYKTFILLSYEIDNKRYIKCPHCSSKNIIKIKETDDLREVIKEHVYKREHGAIRQVR